MSRKEAIEVFEFFKTKEGSQHIAKPVSLDFVISFCTKRKPKRVLEIGSGIGTMSYAVLRYSNATLDLYEGNEWCRKQLEKNLHEFQNRFSINASMNRPPRNNKYDLIIVDGGAGAKGDFGTQSAIVEILKHIQSIGHIYYEGDRKEQQDETFTYLKQFYTFTCTLHKPEVYNDKEWIGGKSYDLTKSDSSLQKNISYRYWQLSQQARLGFRIKRKFKHLLRLT